MLLNFLARNLSHQYWPWPLRVLLPPVITASVRFVPKIRLPHLPPPSLPTPYDGKTSIRRVCRFILGSKNNNILIDIKSEMAGEIEALSQPLSRRHDELYSTIIWKLTEMINGRFEGLGVHHFPIPCWSNVHQHHTVFSAPQCLILNRLHKTGCLTFYHSETQWPQY